MRVISIFLVVLTTALTSKAQIVTAIPAYPTQNDTVTITYDATKGNAGLNGVAPVYMHTGLITDKSSSPSDWKYVQGTWGTDDAKVKMTSIGNNKHQMKFHIASFYGIPTNETALKLAFVFRSADGNKAGRETDGSDIFFDLSDGSFQLTIDEPAARLNVIQSSKTDLSIAVRASSKANLQIIIGDSTLFNGNASDYTADIDAGFLTEGAHQLIAKAELNGNTVYDTANVYFLKKVPIAALPSNNLKNGVNYNGDSSATLVLEAPLKSYAFAIGDFNNWELTNDHILCRTPDATKFHVTINNLKPGKEYAYQYYIDGDVAADWYAEKVLDPWNDQYIDDQTYPNLKSYPTGKTTNIVSIFQTNQEPYKWDDNIEFTRPQKQDLVIYELLIRDFLKEHNYQTLTDTLDYLQGLGINAIELMPIYEFEGNESWGYNPSFFFALDKYYGTKPAFKSFVEECHKRGIAVILDIVLNHSFGQNPMVGLWFNSADGRPAANNPWFNEVAKHDFNVGYDFNHESSYTKSFCNSVLAHWLEEYRVDGFRFDLSKGFTQKNTLGNSGAMAQYDQSRIDILTQYANTVWSLEKDAYVILEHFAENNEEKELASRGMMLWHNLNHQFGEASMGYTSSLSYSIYKNNGFAEPMHVGYMESHDEERMMYRNINFGNSASGYDVTQQSTALSRVELSAVLFYSIPGPKMLWQFGEMGYDFSINRCPDGTIKEDCRLANKPIRWDYLNNKARQRVYAVTKAMIELKKEHNAFRSSDFTYSLNGMVKWIYLEDNQMDVLSMGNFDVNPQVLEIDNPGVMLYEYFTGDSLSTEDAKLSIGLNPGEYRLYTTKKLDKPILNINEPKFSELGIFPNPTSGAFSLTNSGKLLIQNALGQSVFELNNYKSGESINTNLAGGTYIVTVIDEAGNQYNGKLLVH
ncbi:MAG: T9SS type A sorting domain-containing protein [Bacteroidetes bacterium]|nr:T9SS type A sorting domain-containing protein [Bacteroidota bacterium]